MMEFIRKVKGDFLLSSILSIVMGVLLIAWGDKMLLLLGKIIGVFLVVIGVVNLLNFFMRSMEGIFTGVLGLVIALIGVWVFLHPENIISIVPIIMGVMLIFHGIKNLMYSVDSRQYQNDRWGVGILLALIDVCLGVVCIMDAFGVMAVALIFVGIAMIYSGLSNFWVVFRVSKAEKNFRANAVDEPSGRSGKADKDRMIDVEFKD